MANNKCILNTSRSTLQKEHTASLGSGGQGPKEAAGEAGRGPQPPPSKDAR